MRRARYAFLAGYVLGLGVAVGALAGAYVVVLLRCLSAAA